MHKKENSPNCTYMAMGSQTDIITQERDLGGIVKKCHENIISVVKIAQQWIENKPLCKFLA